MTQLPEVVQSECKDCAVRVHWTVVDRDPTCEVWQPIDAACGKHSQNHHEATTRARMNKSGRAYAGPVSARLLTKRAAAIVSR